MNILVLGAGESGTGAAVLAAKNGHNVLVSDGATIKEKYKNVLSKNNIKAEESQHAKAKDFPAELVIKSPGIPKSASIVQHFVKLNIEIIDEIEWAFQHCHGEVVAITGSNGKTTTTELVFHVLKRGNLNVGMAGNIGKSWAAQLAEGQKDLWVLELSSFQLDGIKTFRPKIAIITNITPDHLDRYENSMIKYTHSKMRITKNQKDNDYLIFCQDDEWTNRGIKETQPKAQPIPFSLKEKEMEQGAWLNDKQIEFNIAQKPFTMNVFELALEGKHNTQNSMAAGLTGRILEIRKEAIRESLSDFKEIPHRLEYVATVHGIDFVNDSKATNVNSTWWALESAEKPLIWILGGVDKGNDYSSLIPLAKDKVKAIVCLGADNAKIIEAFSGVVDNMVEVSSAKQAVDVSYQLGKKGDSVLLSPACASFDLFDSYEDRGNQFKAAVKAL